MQINVHVFSNGIANVYYKFISAYDPSYCLFNGFCQLPLRNFETKRYSCPSIIFSLCNSSAELNFSFDILTVFCSIAWVYGCSCVFFTVKYFLPVYCFLLFNVGDLIGRTLAGVINLVSGVFLLNVWSKNIPPVELIFPA